MNHQLIADLERARALIDTPEKWWQSGGHNWRAEHECLCAGLAIEEACIGPGGWDREGECYSALGFGGMRDIAKWNDAPERTHAEVLATFDRAIANERSKA